jgi:hypothetical protein
MLQPMKYYMSLACLFLAISPAFSQKLQMNETDKSSGQKRMETEYGSLLMKDFTFLAIKYRSLDSAYFIEFRGGDIGVGTITPKDALIVLLEDGSNITIYPTSRQDFTLDDNRRYYRHEYAIKKEQINKLAQQKPVSIRKYANNQFEDIEIPAKNQKVMKDFSSFFLKHIN